MGFRKRISDAADRLASAVSRTFVTAPDHPGRGGITGEGDDQDGGQRNADDEGSDGTR